jgi:uncharacterized protein
MNTLSLPHVSLVFAALCALLQVALAALVIQRRAAAGINFLDGGDATLLQRMRAHGNFTETAPMALLLLLMLEVAGLPAAWLWAFGAALVASRLLHAYGLLVGKGLFGRVAGTLLGLALLGAEAAACAWLFVR